MMITLNGRFFGKKQTGLQRYAREMIFALDRLLMDMAPDHRPKVRLVIANRPHDSISLRHIEVRRTRPLPGPMWVQFVLPWYTKGLLLSFENIGPLAIKRQLLCVHDLNTFVAPESYSKLFRLYYHLMLPLCIKRAARLITVSHFSARALSSAGYRRLETISVIPNGHEHVARWDAAKSAYSRAGAFSRDFVFILGARARHKNVQIIERIAGEIDRLGFDIVVAGPRDGPFASVEERGITNVKNLGFVSDDDLAALYRQAFCFLFPSLTEGFGVPALEALALGCPVIATSAASLPEVCGHAALYADPLDAGAWLAQIGRLKADPGLRTRLVAAGFEQATTFSWTDGAKMFLDLITTHGHVPL